MSQIFSREVPSVGVIRRGLISNALCSRSELVLLQRGWYSANVGDENLFICWTNAFCFNESCFGLLTTP